MTRVWQQDLVPSVPAQTGVGAAAPSCPPAAGTSALCCCSQRLCLEKSLLRTHCQQEIIMESGEEQEMHWAGVVTSKWGCWSGPWQPSCALHGFGESLRAPPAAGGAPSTAKTCVFTAGTGSLCCPPGPLLLIKVITSLMCCCRPAPFCGDAEQQRSLGSLRTSTMSLSSCGDIGIVTGGG